MKKFKRFCLEYSSVWSGLVLGIMLGSIGMTMLFGFPNMAASDWWNIVGNTIGAGIGGLFAYIIATRESKNTLKIAQSELRKDRLAPITKAVKHTLDTYLKLYRIDEREDLPEDTLESLYDFSEGISRDAKAAANTVLGISTEMANIGDTEYVSELRDTMPGIMKAVTTANDKSVALITFDESEFEKAVSEFREACMEVQKACLLLIFTIHKIENEW